MKIFLYAILYIMKQFGIMSWQSWFCLVFIYYYKLSLMYRVSQATSGLKRVTATFKFCLTSSVRVRGVIQPALFTDGHFSIKLKCWRAQIFWLFLYTYGDPPYPLLAAPNCQKKGVLEHFCHWRDRNLDLEICFFDLSWS